MDRRMAFCTVINCMDGRVQLPVIEYLKDRFNVDYVDTITESGPVKILALRIDTALLASIAARLDISVTKHKSRAIAIVAHHDCTGNQIDRDTQLAQLKTAVDNLKEDYPAIAVVALWVDETWTVTEPE